jgi:DNA polymerase (family 10)
LRHLFQGRAGRIAGSYRRRKDTVGDLDILVAADKASDVMERFIAYDEVAEVVAHGDTRSTVMLRSGLQVDLRVVPEESYGAALHYFTGSKAHNIAVRKLRGTRSQDQRVWRLRAPNAWQATRNKVYVRCAYPIPPELREDRGEIAAAALQAPETGRN